MRVQMLVVLGVAATAGCVPRYMVPKTKPTAELQMVVESDSPPGSTMLRNFYIWVFKDESCHPSDYGTLASQMFLGDSPSHLAPRQIVAKEPFIFTASYIDARFGQNRMCSITASFVPEAGRTYQGIFHVSDGVFWCELFAYDTTPGKAAGEVAVSMPRYACLANNERSRKPQRPGGGDPAPPAQPTPRPMPADPSPAPWPNEP